MHELNVFSLDTATLDIEKVLPQYDTSYRVEEIKHSNVFVGIRTTSLESLAERFWSKVTKTDGCWMWKASLHRQGYGFFKVGQKNMLAHRVAYWLTTGKLLPPDMKLLHSCDTPGCVNPDHLSEGTQLDNVMDMIYKGRHVGSRKITDEQVQAIRNDTRSQVVIEREYGLAHGAVSRIKSGTSYSDVEGDTKITFDLIQLEVRRETAKLIESGDLDPKAECSECGSTYLVRAHHVDYSKPNEVNWWCRPCRKRWIRRHSFELCTFSEETTDVDIGVAMNRYLYHFQLPNRNHVKVWVGVAHKPSRPKRETQDALA